METLLPTVGRKRARPAAHETQVRLRENVLNLMRTTKAPLVAQRRRIELAYDAAWRAFYRVTRGEDGDEFKTALRGLARVSRQYGSMRDTLVRRIGSSIVASRGHARQQRLLLVWTWLGHTHMGDGGRLWEFRDVLVAVAMFDQDRQNESAVSEWIRGAMASLIDASNDNLPRRLVSISSGIIQYLVRIAFHNRSAEANGSKSLGYEKEPRRDAASLAQDVLQSVCRGSDAAKKPLVLVCHALCDSIQQHGQDAALVTTLRVFLRAEIKAFVLETVASKTDADAADNDTMDRILETLQSCVSAADVVQLFRQVWTETETHPTKPRDTIDALAPLISSCAQRDHAFPLHALATAHDLAHEALSALDATLLRHSLELAAAATVGTASDDGNAEDAGYGDWFITHFAAIDASSVSASSTSSDFSRKSLSASFDIGGSSQRCLRAAPSSSIPSSQPQCSLVSTKRHLHFVCAFLLEWDRVESLRRKAHHVFAHLSAMKTHYTLSGSAVGGLLSEFCSQTRARVAQLEANEQETTTRCSSMTRSAVEELLELHRHDHAALGRRLNQYKMFEAIAWKQQVLPCCLDLAYWQETTSSVTPQSGHEEESQQVQQQRRKRTSEIVSLVQMLAKYHAVGTQEYVAFLERVEAWVLSLKQPKWAQKGRISMGSNKHSLDVLCEAVQAFSEACADLPSGEHQLRDQWLRASWESTTTCFVAAFEGLVRETPTDQHEQMQTIYESTMERLAAEVVARRISCDQATELYNALWIALLSSETDNDEATPQDRMQVMEAYCKFACQRATPTAETARLAEDERLVETTLLGCLLGLLASVTVCEVLARSASLTFCLALEPSTAEPSVDDLVDHLKRSSAYLSGFLSGFITNPTESAPQMLLQSMLTPPMQECLIWVGHHTSTWWWNTESTDKTSHDRFWPFVGRVLQSVHDHHGWFRLTNSPGAFTTKSQWQVFLAMELTCCVTQLLQRDHPSRMDMVDFIHRQHEQTHSLMLSSAGARAAGVCVVDVCIWITQATLELSASSPPVAAFALDALVLLLKDLWLMQASVDGSGESISSVLGFLMEMTLQLIERVPAQRRHILQCAVRCAAVWVEARSSAPLLIEISPVIIREFVGHVACSADAGTIPYEWTSVAWCIVLKLQHANDIYATTSEIPISIVAHWAYEFPRLCRLLTVHKNGKVHHATNATLLRTVQTCCEFFRTLHVRRLAPAPSLSLFGVSASQYVPTSSADETLALHVHSLAWLIASNLIQTPPLAVGISSASPLNFETSLAFHDFAMRVLAALLEDVSIDRPEDVAVELTEICQSSWLASVSSDSPPVSLRYQLLLIHMVADLTARHTSVARFLLRSSSELLNDSRRGLFLLLVLTTAKEIEQIDSLLKLNGSLWVNTFAEVACSLAEIDTKENDGIVSLVRHSDGFGRQLVAVLSRLLSFAASQQIDLLDPTVLARMDKLFPVLRDLLARVPVLHLASAALADW